MKVVTLIETGTLPEKELNKLSEESGFVWWDDSYALGPTFASIPVLSLEFRTLSQSLSADEELETCSSACLYANRQLDMCLPSVSIPGNIFSMT